MFHCEIVSDLDAFSFDGLAVFPEFSTDNRQMSLMAIIQLLYPIQPTIFWRSTWNLKILAQVPIHDLLIQIHRQKWKVLNIQIEIWTNVIYLLGWELSALDETVDDHLLDCNFSLSSFAFGQDFVKILHFVLFYHCFAKKNKVKSRVRITTEIVNWKIK